MTRFDYITYSEQSAELSDGFKGLCTHLERHIETYLFNSREKSIAITKLEECFMWIGKAIKQGQLRIEKDLSDEVLKSTS